jgi:hypothetical protein
MIALKKITVAVTHMDAMVAFYHTLLQLDFTDATFKSCTLKKAQYKGIEILFCPNEIAEVHADQGRHQFEFVHPEYAEFVKQDWVKAFMEEDESDHQSVTLVDPDGNTVIVSAA